jgi:serine/threonine protein kinase/Tfp pilus assembly protein PilF
LTPLSEIVILSLHLSERKAMGVKCPKCQHENPDDTLYCGKCATQLPSPEKVEVTETLETPKEELTTGSTFAERYQIIEELGKGGMGRVYKALDTKIKEKIALKLIKPEIAKDKKTIERFSNELRLARKIRHKNVCGMFDLGEEKGTHYITMEFVPGEDLGSSIRRFGQLPIGKSISITKQICEGLAEAHRLGVIHRDLKSNNIMIDKEGNVRIMDFGIARSLEAKGITGAGVMIGTPEYMSPEQVEGKEVDQRSDIYSLGVILYEMITGRVPFEGDTPFTIGMKHKGEMPQNPKELNTQISDDLNRVILRCLEKDKEKRYQSVGEVRSELSNIEKGIPATERVAAQRKPLTSKEITVTFGLKKLFIPSLIVVALAAIAIILWQLLPQKKLYLAPKIEDSIAVISFENQTGDESFDYLQKAIPNLLITNLENTGFLYVVTWERLHDLLKQKGKADVEIIDRELGFELCRIEGIEAIVLGTFTKAGDMFVTDVKVLDVQTKKILKSASSKGVGERSILESQIDELSREVAQGMGVAKLKIEEAQLRIADVTTNSMEAYKYFLKGREAYEQISWEDARQYFERAVEIDSTFTMAYLNLAWVYDLLGNTKALKDTLRIAKTLEDKASDKERLYIEAEYANFIENDSDKFFKTLNEIARKYPKEKIIFHYLGDYFYYKKMLPEAVAEFRKALELDPYYGFILYHLALAHIYLLDYEKAIEFLERHAQVTPNDPSNPYLWGLMYVYLNRLDDALENFKEVIRLKSNYIRAYVRIFNIHFAQENYVEAINWVDKGIANASNEGEIARAYLMRGIYHYWLGSFTQALSEIDMAEKLAERVENMTLERDAEWLKGVIFYSRSELENSQKHFRNYLDIAVDHFPQYISYHRANYLIGVGLIDLKQGKIASAKSKIADAKPLVLKTEGWEKDEIAYRFDLFQGEVLLAEGSLEEAIHVSDKPMPVGYVSELPFRFLYDSPFLRDVQARAYQKKGDIDQAILVYEQMISSDPKSNERFLIHPKHYYRLAMLYEQKSRKEKATEHYEKFLSLWKNADPGMAEVEDAKKRLAGLRSQ